MVVALLDWLPAIANQHNLLCCVNPELVRVGEKIWIHVFLEVICLKVNVMNSAGIQNWFTDFSSQADLLYTACLACLGDTCTLDNVLLKCSDQNYNNSYTRPKIQVSRFNNPTRVYGFPYKSLIMTIILQVCVHLLTSA